MPETATGPLAGLRIVELSSYVATPLSGMVLGQLGAEVIRVEQLGGAPDRTRLPRAASGTSLYWSGLNKGKRAVAVDLTRPEGRALVAELIVAGDGIVVSNSERWPDLAYAGLRERREDVIHVLLTGRRDGGTAVDYTVQAETGFPYVTGPADGPGDRARRPVNHVLPAWDVAAGLYLATGLLAAERERRLTGKGQQVRLALEDVALATAGALGYLAEAQLGGVGRGASGNDVYGTYGRDFVSADGVRFMLVVLTGSHWRRLLEATGLVDAMHAVEKALDADLEDEAERYRCRGVISGLLEGVFSRTPWAELEPLLRGTRALVSAYRTFDDLAADDAAALRGSPLFAELDQPGVGPHLAPGSPLVMDGRQAPAGPAPRVGEHTDEVLAESLGLDADRLAALHADGILG
ncbi:CoA transferase [Nocardioides cheoyonin]|uniref:CoA transferase n=1 Tax=Nocardioides cheoyonin TaxID=3156615 RepID=UPI0032B4C3C6